VLYDVSTLYFETDTNPAAKVVRRIKVGLLRIDGAAVAHEPTSTASGCCARPIERERRSPPKAGHPCTCHRRVLGFL
jgi:hypothetical protein